MVDLVKAGVTTECEDTGGLTPYDKLVIWAHEADGYNLSAFDADDAEAIVHLIIRLVESGGSVGNER